MLRSKSLGSAITTSGLLLLPSTVMAEVMDKVGTPWDLRRLVLVAIVSAVCATAAWRPGRARTLLALVLAVAWATMNIAFDPLHDDPIVAQAMQWEMSPLAFEAYRILTPMEALVPLAVMAAVVARRRRRAAPSTPV